jgi:hypothetical protein
MIFVLVLVKIAFFGCELKIVQSPLEFCVLFHFLVFQVFSKTSTNIIGMLSIPSYELYLLVFCKVYSSLTSLCSY